ncbi:hypothetical protein B0H14DRAFT_2621940 [Mycena olivaceomarginata]|nr:hypothetical protein B0H14DRAFT_2621940 [Mycena olivaceomarginata]
MSPPLGEIWGPFHHSEDRPNGSHHSTTHWRGINTFQPPILDLKESIRIRPSHTAVLEGLYMELLAAEHSGEEPDDGELEGSRNDYFVDINVSMTVKSCDFSWKITLILPL